MKQRYNTVGDYYYNLFGSLVVLVSDMGDWRMEFLIAYHELSEIPLCWEAGITIREIDEFDMEYDLRREPGNTSEPGDDQACPYYHCHQYASQQEREMCAKFGIDWDEYDCRIAELLKKRAQEEVKK